MKQRGFTLVELLTVIAVISILTAIVASSLFSSLPNSRDKARISDIEQIAVAVRLIAEANRAFPEVTAYTDVSNAGTLTTSLESVFGGAGIPVDPSSDETHYYGYSSNYTCGETGKVIVAGVLEVTEKSNYAAVCGTQPTTPGMYIVVVN